MLEANDDLLIHPLESMIAEGDALVHGGRLFAWENTNLSGLPRAIREEKAQSENLPPEPGAPHRVLHWKTYTLASGQW